ncbi:hypothetical protein CTAYLR_004329 [Chrysophaeum taylorii]|uniref:J domain-containing protein n=1 Tax=Chrysophaeum taylorii TaxID=2483200 RepID=A0AAD7XQB2_9STRA|nr:hypothetical protein CTAYLR_004329 [Chrysophaeum taylorii]
MGEKLRWRGPSYGGATIEPFDVLGVSRKEEKEPAVVVKAKTVSRSDEKAKKERGDMLMREKEYEAAARVYGEALALNPRSVVAMSNRCAALLAAKRAPAAVLEARRLVEAAPSWAKARGRLVAALHAAGDPESAAREASLGLELWPGNESLEDALRRATEASNATRVIYVSHEDVTLKLQLTPRWLRKTCRELAEVVRKRRQHQQSGELRLEGEGQWIPGAMLVGDVVRDGTRLVARPWAAATEAKPAKSRAPRRRSSTTSKSSPLDAARLAFGLSNWKAAIEAALANPDDDESRLIHVRALAAQRKWEEVLEACDRYYEEVPSQLLRTYEKASRYAGRDDGRVVEDPERAVAEDPEDPIARLALARSLLTTSPADAANQASIALGLGTSPKPLLVRAEASLGVDDAAALLDLLDFLDLERLQHTPEAARARHLVATLVNAGVTRPDRARKLDWTGVQWHETVSPDDDKDPPTRDADFDDDVDDHLDAGLYGVLGLDRTASPADIRRAYRSLALRLHPDKNPQDPDAHRRFARLAHAYAVLSDPQNRLYYDNQSVVH